MNANELAEQLDEYVGNNGYSHNDYSDSMSQASTMLRQQQAEIANLKSGLLSHHDIYPVKELTDEEITEVLNDENIAEYHQGNWLVLPYAFARAILRKAQEK